MRNSLLPLALTALVALVAVLLIPEGKGMGSEGPELSAGILRLPKKAEKMVSAAPLEATWEVERGAVARAPGLEPEPWRVVGIAADDREPLTRAVVLGLAEELTVRGGVAVIDVQGQAPAPIPLDRVLRVATVRADPLGAQPGPWGGSVRVRQRAVLLPAGHPAAGLQGAAGVPERELVVEHRGRPRELAQWPQWWAAVGRGTAGEILRELGVGERLPVEWDRAPVPPRPEPGPLFAFHRPAWLLVALLAPAFLLLHRWIRRRLPADHPAHQRRFAWLRPVLYAVAAVAVAARMSEPRIRSEPVAAPNAHGWTTHLPFPIQADVLRWQGAFEDDLVRGWTGRIAGTTTLDRKLEEQSALEPVLKVLAKYTVEEGQQDTRDRWVEVSAPGAGVRTFRREKDGVEELMSLAATGDGWDCVLWQERARPASVLDDWTRAAKAGDDAARRRLRRHLLSPRLPQDQFTEIVEFLRRDPDAAEVAMLAETPVAWPGERGFARAARWVLGREETPVAEGDQGERMWTSLLAGVPNRTDARPLLVQVRETLALLLPTAGGGVVIARSPAGRAEFALPASGTAVFDLPGGGALAVQRDEQGLTLTGR